MSRHMPRRTTIRRALILLVWVGLVALVASPGANSEPSPGGADADSGYEIPPYTGNNQQGPTGVGQRALIPRTKIIIRLPDMLTWFMVRTERDPNYRVQRARAYPVPAEWQSDVPGCQARGITWFTDIYAIGPNRGGQPVGHLSPTTVRALAFGSIPVTATLRLSQIIDGQLVPMQLDYWSDSSAGACDPEWRLKHPEDPAYVRGRLSLTVSDLRIDGQVVDIGDRCRTVEPLQINLWADRPGAEGNWVLSSGGDLYQREDKARAEVPGGGFLHPGSTDLTIPEFTGCVSAAGEDVSRLLTTTISGAGNQIAARQSRIIIAGGGNSEASRDNPTGCYVHPETAERVCPLPAPSPPEIPVPAE